MIMLISGLLKQHGVAHLLSCHLQDQSLGMQRNKNRFKTKLNHGVLINLTVKQSVKRMNQHEFTEQTDGPLDLSAKIQVRRAHPIVKVETPNMDGSRSSRESMDNKPTTSDPNTDKNLSKTMNKKPVTSETNQSGDSFEITNHGSVTSHTNRNEVHAGIILRRVSVIEERYQPMDPFLMEVIRQEYEHMLHYLPSARFLTSERLRDLIPYDHFLRAAMRIYHYSRAYEP